MYVLHLYATGLVWILINDLKYFLFPEIMVLTFGLSYEILIDSIGKIRMKRENDIK